MLEYRFLLVKNCISVRQIQIKSNINQISVLAGYKYDYRWFKYVKSIIFGWFKLQLRWSLKEVPLSAARPEGAVRETQRRSRSSPHRNRPHPWFVGRYWILHDPPTVMALNTYKLAWNAV